VKIALPSLGYIMVAEVEKQNIEIITASGHSFVYEGQHVTI